MLNDDLMILKIEVTTSQKDPILLPKKFIITMNIKGTAYMNKINPVTSWILHWKDFLVTYETK